MFGSHARKAVLLASVSAVLAGCATPPDLGQIKHIAPPQSFATAQTFEAAGAAASTATQAAWPADNWWTAYGDPQLDALVEEALQGSPSLAVAAARLRKAEAAVQQAGAARKPTGQIKSGAQGTVQHIEADFPADLEASLPNDFSFRTSATAELTYQLDFWGRNRAALAAATSTGQAAQAELASARLQLSSAVALAYADLVRLAADRQQAEGAVKIRQDSGALVAQRLKRGVENEGEAHQADAQLAQARADLADIDGQISGARVRLAALLGKGPDRGLAIALPTRPALLAQALPADAGIALIGRRPDLASARLRAEAAAQRIKVAKADFYPNVSLNAVAGLQTLGIEKLGGGSFAYGQIGPAVTLPIFAKPRLEGAYRSARADYDEAVALYDQALTQALEEVAETLSDRKALEARLVQTRLALQASEASYRLVRVRYSGGLVSYIDTLAVESSLIAQRRAVAALESQAFALDVRLKRALGGGYVSV